jgi:hypothetical protein
MHNPHESQLEEIQNDRAPLVAAWHVWIILNARDRAPCCKYAIPLEVVQPFKSVTMYAIMLTSPEDCPTTKYFE